MTTEADILRIFQLLDGLRGKIDSLIGAIGNDMLPRLARLEQWQVTHERDDERTREMALVNDARLGRIELVLARIDGLLHAVDRVASEHEKLVERQTKAEKVLERWQVGVAAAIVVVSAAISGAVHWLFGRAS